MNTLIVQEHVVGNLAYTPFLFNSPAYLNGQSSTLSSNSFYLVDPLKSLCLAQFHCRALDNHKVKSPYRAPFGSIEFSDDVSIDSLTFFWNQIESKLIKLGYTEITISSYPSIYKPKQASLLDELYLSQGFGITVEERNQYLFTGQSDVLALHDSEKRKLKKLIQEGFTFRPETNPDLEYAHHLVQTSRTFMGHPLSMSLQDFCQSYAQLPQQYTLFTVRHEGNMVACATGIKVSDQILYYFLPGDDISYRKYSPMVLLLEGMFKYCQTNHYQLFDLGISTSGGVLNEGLFRFKKNFGALECPKYIYHKKLNVR